MTVRIAEIARNCSSDGANEGKLSIYSSRIYQKLFGKVLYLYFYLRLHKHKIGSKYDLADTKLVTDENEEKKFYHSNVFLTKIDPRDSDMTDTQFRDEQHGARESYDKPCPEPKELEQTLVRELDAGTSEQLPIKTIYSQGQHKNRWMKYFLQIN